MVVVDDSPSVVVDAGIVVVVDWPVEGVVVVEGSVVVTSVVVVVVGIVEVFDGMVVDCVVVVVGLKRHLRTMSHEFLPSGGGISISPSV